MSWALQALRSHADDHSVRDRHVIHVGDCGHLGWQAGEESATGATETRRVTNALQFCFQESISAAADPGFVRETCKENNIDPALQLDEDSCIVGRRCFGRGNHWREAI